MMLLHDAILVWCMVALLCVLLEVRELRDADALRKDRDWHRERLSDLLWQKGKATPARSKLGVLR
jgi:hypothetical protein